MLFQLLAWVMGILFYSTMTHHVSYPESMFPQNGYQEHEVQYG